jgi:hypothetical protein
LWAALLAGRAFAASLAAFLVALSTSFLASLLASLLASFLPSFLAPATAFATAALLAAGAFLARRTFVPPGARRRRGGRDRLPIARATVLAAAALLARGTLFAAAPARAFLPATATATFAARGRGFGAARSSAPLATPRRALLAAAAAAAAPVVGCGASGSPLGRLLDRAARATRNAHPERARPDPQESALSFLDGGDHRLGARQSKRLETLADRLVERLALIH